MQGRGDSSVGAKTHGRAVGINLQGKRGAVTLKLKGEEMQCNNRVPPESTGTWETLSRWIGVCVQKVELVWIGSNIWLRYMAEPEDRVEPTVRARLITQVAIIILPICPIS